MLQCFLVEYMLPNAPTVSRIEIKASNEERLRTALKTEFTYWNVVGITLQS